MNRYSASQTRNPVADSDLIWTTVSDEGSSMTERFDLKALMMVQYAQTYIYLHCSISFHDQVAEHGPWR